MLDTLTFAELEAQEPELLPPRTVLSLISMNGNKCGALVGCIGPILSGNNTNVCLLNGWVSCKAVW